MKNYNQQSENNVHKDTRRFIKVMVIQSVGIIVTSLVLDGGEMLKCFSAGCLIYWIFYLYKKIFNTKVDRFDLWFLNYGYFVFFAGIYVCANNWEHLKRLLSWII
ncbi:MAG: hypothetical protein LBU65_12390 [Planctomycetaceae bacterium]|nr:hypothetical protein [Planctomycetaceae bacterium]